MNYQFLSMHFHPNLCHSILHLIYQKDNNISNLNGKLFVLPNIEICLGIFTICFSLLLSLHESEKQTYFRISSGKVFLINSSILILKRNFKSTVYSSTNGGQNSILNYGTDLPNNPHLKEDPQPLRQWSKEVLHEGLRSKLISRVFLLFDIC